MCLSQVQIIASPAFHHCVEGQEHHYFYKEKHGVKPYCQMLHWKVTPCSSHGFCCIVALNFFLCMSNASHVTWSSCPSTLDSKAWPALTDRMRHKWQQITSTYRFRGYWIFLCSSQYPGIMRKIDSHWLTSPRKLGDLLSWAPSKGVYISQPTAKAQTLEQKQMLLR